MPSSCTPAEKPLKNCSQYISSVSGGVVKYTSTCKISSYTAGSCSKSDNGDKWIKVGFGSISAGGSCGIQVKIEGTYSWGGKAYDSSSWVTYKCNSSTERGTGYYCTGSKLTSACKKSNTACAG